MNSTHGKDGYQTLTISESQLNKKIKIVQINLPKSLNALSTQLISELSCALNRLNDDVNTKVIILTGVGKAFVSGANIKEFKNTSYQDRISRLPSLEKLTNLYYQIKKPIIAAVNGYCFGGGLELALCCDMIFASDKAVLGFPEIKLGLFPGAGGSQKLVKYFGYLKAYEYIMTGKNIPLEDAKQRGLINDIYTSEDLLNKVEKTANTLCGYGLISLINAKQAMQNSLEVGLRQGIMTEKYLFEPLFCTEDKDIGVTAFINKKKPEFKDN